MFVMHKFAPDKPVEISEIASAEQGGNKAQWITNMFLALKALPQIKSVIWYDIHTKANWRIDSSKASIAAFRAGAADPRYR